MFPSYRNQSFEIWMCFTKFEQISQTLYPVEKYFYKASNEYMLF